MEQEPLNDLSNVLKEFAQFMVSMKELNCKIDIQRSDCVDFKFTFLSSFSIEKVIQKLVSIEKDICYFFLADLNKILLRVQSYPLK